MRLLWFGLSIFIFPIEMRRSGLYEVYLLVQIENSQVLLVFSLIVYQKTYYLLKTISLYKLTKLYHKRFKMQVVKILC